MVIDDKPALMARATEIATRMTAMAPLTIAASLEGLRRLRHDTPLPDDRDLITKIYQSADFAGGGCFCWQTQTGLARTPGRDTSLFSALTTARIGASVIEVSINSVN